MSEKEMMVVEAMKTLRVIEKKMADNTIDIQRYASQVSTERPLFETEDKQKQEIKGLIQSNEDLLQRYLNLKQRIEYSNLMTVVEMDGDKYSISELLVIQRKLAMTMFATYDALNDSEGKNRLRHTQMSQTTGEQPHVVRFYKEEDRREKKRTWQDLMNNITTRLEVINATTPLLDLPSMS